VNPSLVVRAEAEADIEEAYAWYESRSVGLGERFLDAGRRDSRRWLSRA
jgi:hypothetical protein